MKQLLIAGIVFLLAGFGCAGTKTPTIENLATYANTEYGFAFDYDGAKYQVVPSIEKSRSQKMYGLDADLFAATRDTSRGDPFNIINMYAREGMTTGDYVKAVESSGPNNKVKSQMQVTKGKIKMTEIVSSTDSGTDKYHYLFDRNGVTIVLSVGIQEEETVAPMLATFRGL